MCITLGKSKNIQPTKATTAGSFLLFWLFIAAPALMADPPTGSGWQVIPELTDEFDGTTLDSNKWWNYNPGWLGRQPGYFSPNNVTVSDGKLHLTARVESLPNLPTGYHTYTTAAVKGKTLVKYGYFEIKSRSMNSKASSAFWFYQDTPQEWTEIDVFETCGEGSYDNTYNMNVHVFRSPTVTNHFQSSQTWRPTFDMADEYHVYALEWTKDVIRWWVDGTVRRQIANTHWHQPLHMNFDSETFPTWFGLPDPASLPSTFSIEYVRSWSAPTQVAWTSASQVSSSESGTMTVTAALSSVSSEDVTVPFTISGTASASDYTITPSPIIIPAGQTTGTATITITEDFIIEPDETVILTLGTPTNAMKGATTVHGATIKSPPPPTSVVTYTDSNGLNPTNTPYANGYVVHTFYSGSNVFTPPAAVTSVDVLVVGGGGGGGGIGTNDWGAGGGAGGLVYSNAFPVTPSSNYTVTVGGGGTAGGAQGGSGSNSVFGTLTALGGGGGSDDVTSRAGVAGGSGGGSYGGTVGSGQQAGSSSGGFGNSGGLGGGGGGGGGGGAGAPGSAAGTTYAGAGGIGRQYSISGVATYYAGGGSGAGNSTGGLGGGGRGGVSGQINGVANTGGGGAGAVKPSAAGSGGSGIVIVRYQLNTTPPTLSTTNPADGASEVLANTNLVATFSEPIAIGNGNITLKNLTDGTQADIAVTDATQVSVSGAVLTLNPTADLLLGTNYALQIDDTAIDDTAGNSFAGITDDTTWNFTTATAYETWTAANAPVSAADDDSDNDGLPNAIEFVLGGDKDTNDFGKLPVIATPGTDMTISFVRDRSSVDPSVSVVIVVGPDLATWPDVFTVGADTAGSTEGITVTDNGDGTDSITLSIPREPGTNKFARLVVDITP